MSRILASHASCPESVQQREMITGVRVKGQGACPPTGDPSRRIEPKQRRFKSCTWTPMAESLPSRRRGGGQTGWRNQRRFGRDSIHWLGFAVGNWFRQSRLFGANL